MKRLLSIFSFEGFILEYPVPRDEVSKWLKNPKCLNYPLVPDIPGPSYWDDFAIETIKKCQKETKHEICIFSEIEMPQREIEKRIKFLLKSVGVEADVIFVNSKSEKIESFYKKNINLFLTKNLMYGEKYKEVNIYLNDFELTSIMGDHIMLNFALKTVLHDI